MVVIERDTCSRGRFLSVVSKTVNPSFAHEFNVRRHVALPISGTEQSPLVHYRVLLAESSSDDEILPAQEAPSFAVMH